MSCYNPKIYNKQNLKEKDLRELEYYEGVFHTLIDNVVEDYEQEDYPKGIDVLVEGIAKDFAERLKVVLGYQLNEDMVSIIDNYDEDDVEEIENPETFDYEDEDGE